MTAFAVVTEDALSEAIAETLLHQVGIHDIQIRLRKEGFGYLRSRIADFNRIAEKVMPVLLITDLDRNRCPPRMIADWLPVPAAHGSCFGSRCGKRILGAGRLHGLCPFHRRLSRGDTDRTG